MTRDTPYRVQLTEDDNPAREIIRAVATLTGARRGGLKPLYSVVDPNSLNRFYRNSREASISFEYEGYRITVRTGGDIVLRDPESIYARSDDPSNILLVAPSSADADRCTELLHPSPVRDENVLGVLVEKSVDEKAYAWQDRERPANRKLISLGEFARSTETRTIRTPDSITLELIGDDDLSTLGERIVQSLTAWESNRNQSTVCFESLDQLIDRFGLEETISFVHTLRSRVEAVGGIAHYHLDPGECTQEEMNAVVPLFDAAVYEDRECTIRM